MSLKAFHLFFVAAGIVATSAYGMWRMVSVLREGAAELPAASLSLLAGVALLVHGVRFYKDTEKEPWL
jgi:hypothetical protein